MATKQKLSKEALVIKKDNGKDNIVLEFGKLKRAVLTLRAINHPLRKKIVSMLEDKRKMTVTEIYDILKIEQSVASQHLAILRRAEIVTTKREGKFIFYGVNKKRIGEITNIVEDLAQKE
ncbi:MAG TPA: metalloregulator ArsR/SmtB family transcription factor [Chitinophagales bacterium]|nr:metalloregulator ArsR/SmtB family transcription factor [Chitinophagales bacterium]HLP51706.1 metalloregulator ArsR/SmtB family transcription factor [Chitinophagales bacterium]